MAPAGAGAPDRRLDQVSFVTVHNAYAREDAPPDARGFDAYVAKLYDLGVRGLELDFAEHDRHWEWSVGHSDAYTADMPRQLGVYLRSLWAWSIQHEPHDPMVIYLEPKSEFAAGFPAAFDEYLAANFDAPRIFRPADLLGAAAHLADATRGRAWPSVAALQNRFLFVISGDGEAARAVASRPESLCFGDRPLADTPGRIADTGDPDRIVLNLPAPLMPGVPLAGAVLGISEKRWIEILDEVAETPWLLPRVYYCDKPDHVRLALQHGAWMLATNTPNPVLSILDHVPYRDRPLAAARATATTRAGATRRATATAEAAATTRATGPARAGRRAPRKRARG
jgi:hypothetical protein